MCQLLYHFWIYYQVASEEKREHLVGSPCGFLNVMLLVYS